MEIIVGSIPPLQSQNQKPPRRGGEVIEALLLHVRPPRKGIAGPSGRERRNKAVNDPKTARILTIMVPDASLLPPDLSSEKYDVTLRLVRK